MANPRYNTQTTNRRGAMGGGVAEAARKVRAGMKKGGKIPPQLKKLKVYILQLNKLSKKIQILVQQLNPLKQMFQKALWQSYKLQIQLQSKD